MIKDKRIGKIPYNKKWTEEAIRKEASKYTTLKDFRTHAIGAHDASKKMGIYEDIKRGLKLAKKFKWTDEEIQEEALKYKSRSEFENNSNAYSAALRKGVIDIVCSHMPKDSKIGKTPHNKKWTEELVALEAKKYIFRSDFQNRSPGAHTASKNLGIHAKVTSHMLYKRKEVPVHNKIWTEEKIQEEALKYKTRTIFYKESKSAYAAAGNLKLLDKVCSHMDTPNNSSLPELELFDIIKEIYPYTKKLRDRKVNIKGKPHIQGFDIDIFIPELNKGIEFDGIYYHSFEFMRKNKKNWSDEDIRNYHQIKDEYFASKGIKLLHITDIAWISLREQSLQKIFKFLEI